MKTLLLVYHSQSGASARLARAALRGARSEAELQVICRRAWDATSADLGASAGVLLVAAENSGALSGGMKDFLDRVFYPANGDGLVLPAAIVISAGNDGRNAARQTSKILSGIPFPLAQEPLILRGEVTPDMEAECEALGAGFAAGIVMGIF